MRVGGNVKITSDVRLVTATLRPLEAEAQAGRFRADLLYRIQGITVRVPPLRERAADLDELIAQFTAEMSARHATRPPRWSREARQAMREHDWPGNVRELRNVIERAVSAGTESLDEKLVVSVPQPYKQAKEQLIEDFTREYFTRLHHQCGGNVAEMAKLAGIARTYAHELVAKFGLKS